MKYRVYRDETTHYYLAYVRKFFTWIPLGTFDTVDLALQKIYNKAKPSRILLLEGDTDESTPTKK